MSSTEHLRRLIVERRFANGNENSGRYPRGSGANPKSDGGKITDPAIVSIASTIHDNAVTIEPKLTKDLMTCAGVHKVELKGADFKIKDTDSLLPKVQEKMLAHPEWTPAQVEQHVYDANRYTMGIASENYTQTAQSVMDKMEAKGYSVDRIRNFWNEGDGSYRGINVVMSTKAGKPFEVQFHTEESWHIKQEVTHPMYKAIAKAYKSGDESKIQKLKGDIVGSWKSVTVPPGVESIKSMEKNK